MCDRKHPDQLCHSLACELLSRWPQGTAKGGENRTDTHHFLPLRISRENAVYTELSRSILKDLSYPDHRLFSLLPSGRHFRILQTKTSRLRNSFFPSVSWILLDDPPSHPPPPPPTSPLPITKSVYIENKKKHSVKLITCTTVCAFRIRNDPSTRYALDIFIFYALSMSIALVFIYLNVSLIHIVCNYVNRFCL